MALMRRWIEAVTDFAAGRRGNDGDEADWRFSAAALLMMVGQADGAFSSSEKKRFEGIAQQALSLNEAEARQLIARASEAGFDTMQLDTHANVLKRNFDARELGRFIEMLWLMGFANGRAGELEESVIARIAQLLGVPDTTMNELRVAVSAPLAQ